MNERSSDHRDHTEEPSNQNRYRQLFEEAREGIAISTPAGKIKEVNPAAVSILGYSRKELKSMNAAELYVNPDDRKEAAETLHEKGTLLDWELQFRRASGERITCSVSATLRRAGTENSQMYHCFFQDVTEQKQAEQALEETEEQFQSLSDHALVGIGLFQDGAWEYINPELEEITGYSSQEVRSTTPELFVHPEDWPEVRDTLKRCLEGEIREVRYEARFRARSGETRHVQVSSNCVTYQGEPAVISTVQDLTDQRRLQREILQVQEEERRRMGQNLHDGVAAQLTGVTMKLSLLQSKSEESCPDLSPRIERVLELVEESNEDLRRISRGLNPVVLQDAGLLPALERLADNTTHCSFRTEDLSSLRTPVGEALSGNEKTHLYWIAQEAVANARRHADADEITICLRAEDRGLMLEVEDDGDGFELSEIGPDDTTQDEIQEGLGLRTMSYRAELLGAQLHLESSPGDGTHVSCHLRH